MKTRNAGGGGAVDYPSVLTTLRAERSKLDAAIVAIEALAPNGNGAAPRGTRTPKPPKAETTRSHAELKREAVRMKKGGSTAKEIRDALGVSISKASTLTAGVKRGSRAGRSDAVAEDEDEAEADDEDDDGLSVREAPSPQLVGGAPKRPWI